MIDRLKNWLLAALVALDIAAATVIFGTKNETISHVAAEARAGGRIWGEITCAVLELVETDHCARVLIDGKQTSAYNLRFLPVVASP